MNKKVYYIPVEWAVFGRVPIEANSVDEALDIFEKTQEEISLPTDNNYIDGTFKLSPYESKEELESMIEVKEFKY